MRSIVWALGCGTVVAAGWWLLHGHGADSPRTDTATTARVLADLAVDLGGSHGRALLWDVDHDSPEPTAAIARAIEVRTTQAAPASFEVAHGAATVETPSWRISVDLSRVTEVVCERRFIHHPPPGTVWLYLAFRDGPEDDIGHASELLRVWFDEDREDQFRRLCDHHGLRKIGDFAVTR